MEPRIFGGSLTSLLHPEHAHIAGQVADGEHHIVVEPFGLPGVIRRESNGQLSLELTPHFRGCWVYTEIATERGEYNLLQKLGVCHDELLRVFAYSRTHGIYIPQRFTVLDITIVRPNPTNVARLNRLIGCADHFFVAGRLSYRSEFYEQLREVILAA